MDIIFSQNAWEDFQYWMETDINTAIKVKELLKSIRLNLFVGIVKPEPLKYDLKGYWSRRITGEHRLVYKISGTKGIDQKCFILQCRFHYDD